MIECIRSQLAAALETMEDALTSFPEEKWKDGFGEFQVPWKIAYHTVQCLHFYFSPGAKPGADWNWGERFGGAWWELSEEDAPSRSQLLDYLAEVKTHIDRQFEIDKNRELQEIYDPQREDALTVAEQYVYALRHTMHHHGSLTTLAIVGGLPQAKWT